MQHIFLFAAAYFLFAVLCVHQVIVRAVVTGEVSFVKVVISLLPLVNLIFFVIDSQEEDKHCDFYHDVRDCHLYQQRIVNEVVELAKQGRLSDQTQEKMKWAMESGIRTKPEGFWNNLMTDLIDASLGNFGKTPQL